MAPRKKYSSPPSDDSVSIYQPSSDEYEFDEEDEEDQLSVDSEESSLSGTESEESSDDDDDDESSIYSDDIEEEDNNDFVFSHEIFVLGVGPVGKSDTVAKLDELKQRDFSVDQELGTFKIANVDWTESLLQEFIDAFNHFK